jgi:hypothetical protein
MAHEHAVHHCIAALLAWHCSGKGYGHCARPHAAAVVSMCWAVASECTALDGGRAEG